MARKYRMVIVCLSLTINSSLLSQSPTLRSESVGDLKPPFCVTSNVGVVFFKPGKFELTTGTYTLNGRPSASAFAELGLLKPVSVSKFVKVSALYSRSTINYSFRREKNFSDSVYSPLSTTEYLSDINFKQLIIKLGLVKEKKLTSKLIATGSLNAGITLLEPSITSLSLELDPPYQLGSKQDTLYVFNKRQHLFVPVVEGTTSIFYAFSRFKVGLEVGITYYTKPLQTGDFVVLPGLPQSSTGNFRSNQTMYSLSGVLKYDLPTKNR